MRLNPQQVQNKSVTRNLFPPKENYFPDLFTRDNFKTLLETNATTPNGMLFVATHYGVHDEWNTRNCDDLPESSCWAPVDLLEVIVFIIQQTFPF